MIRLFGESVGLFSTFVFNNKNFQGKVLLILLIMVLSACQPKKIIIEDDSEIRPWRSDKQIFSLNQSLNELNHAWEYHAKIGLKTNSGNEQAKLIWKYAKQNNKLRLFGPLGMGTIKLNFDQFGAQLVDNKGNIHKGWNAEVLLNDIVGWPLPIDALAQWLFMLPDHEFAYQYRLNADGQLESIRQLGWQIDYKDYRFYAGQLLPRKITAFMQSDNTDLGKVTVKLITKSWQLGVDTSD